MRTLLKPQCRALVAAAIALTYLVGCSMLPWPALIPGGTQYALPYKAERTPVAVETQFQVAWSRSSIIAEPNSGETMMVAFKDCVAVLALNAGAQLEDVRAYASSDGSFLWSAWPGSSATIAKTNRGLAVGTRDGVVALHDPSSGELVWSVDVGSGVLQLVPNAETIYVHSRPDLFTAIALDTGTPLPTPHIFDLPYPFLITDNDMFGLYSRSGIQDIDPRSGEELWATDFGEVFYETPLFFEASLCLRTGLELGRVICLDRTNGQVVWRSDSDVVSNLASYKGSLLALTRQGMLELFDEAAGTHRTIARFTPGPFVLPGEEVVGGYYLAVDQSAGRLFVLLGDSGQIVSLVEDTSK